MSDNLVIRLLDNKKIEWARVSADKNILSSGTTSFAKVKEDLPYFNNDQGDLLVIVPGQDVVLSKANIPSKQSRFVTKILPFIIEEEIAEDIENMHLAIGPSLAKDKKNQSFAVLAAKKSKIDNWLKLLEGAGLNPDILAPETLLIPQNNNGFSILVDGPKAIVRSKDFQGFSIEINSLKVFLETAIADLEEVSFCLYGKETQKIEKILEEISKTIPEGKITKITNHSKSKKPFEILTNGFASSDSYVNLLQGPYYKSKPNDSIISITKKLLFILVLWFFLQISVDITKILYLKGEAEDFHQKSIATYRELFPDDKKIVNLSIQMKNHLKGREGTNIGFLSLMEELSFQLGKIDKKNEIIINNLNFNQERGDLVIDIETKSFEQLNNLKDVLDRSSLEPSISSATSENDFVKARISLKGTEL